MDKVIEISELKKDYNGFAALDGISLDVLDNEIFGIVGPDGAWKTTTIMILCGLLHPTSGSVKIFWNDLIKKKKLIKSQIGYLSQKFSLYVDLTVDENISFISYNIISYPSLKKRNMEFYSKFYNIF